MSLDWQIRWDRRAVKELKKLDKQTQEFILTYLEQRVIKSDNPRELGKLLMYDKRGLWRYRVGNYRIICNILDHEFVILVLRVGHRKHIYR